MGCVKTMLTRQQVKLLWHHHFWDYPRSGALELDGVRYWFQEVASPLDTGVFDIIDLPAQVWAMIDERHQDFREHVGTHCDYTEEKNSRYPSDGKVKPREQWHIFYDKYLNAPEIDITGPVVAQWSYGFTAERG